MCRLGRCSSKTRKSHRKTCDCHNYQTRPRCWPTVTQTVSFVATLQMFVHAKSYMLTPGVFYYITGPKWTKHPESHECCSLAMLMLLKSLLAPVSPLGLSSEYYFSLTTSNCWQIWNHLKDCNVYIEYFINTDLWTETGVERNVGQNVRWAVKNLC